MLNPLFLILFSILLIFTQCSDLCDNNNGGCNINADCYDLRNGHVQCVCKDGWYGNGKNCVFKEDPSILIIILFH